MSDQASREYTSKEPFKAELLITQESYDVVKVKDNGYHDKIVKVEGGILLKITITAPTLEKLAERINGHVALIS